MNENKVKVVIPARYLSTRLPKKLLLELKGKPIYWHVVQRALEAKFDIENILVATESKEIYQSAVDENIPVQMTSADHKSGTDRINEIATVNNWSDDTVILNVQGDEPLILPALISKLAKFTSESTNFDVTTAVTPIRNVEELQNPNVVKAIIGENSRAIYFTRSHCPYNRENPSDFSEAYRHIGIYGYKVAALRHLCALPESKLEAYEKLEQLRALSNGLRIGAFIVDTPPAHGVDTLEDYEHLKSIMES